MMKFLLFIGALTALLVLLSSLVPLLLFGLGVWLLYLVFKKFMETDTIVAKIGWATLGLMILSVTISNSYALIGIVALAALYLIYKNWKKPGDDSPVVHEMSGNDPFSNFEREWADLNK